MIRLNLNQNQFSDLLNLSNDVFFPIKKFVNKSEFEKILDKLQYKKKFYPYPIFFGINKYTYKKIKFSQKLNFYFRSKLIASISNINFFNIDKKKFGKKIYGKNYINHPYFKKFNSENFIFMNFKISKIYKIKINEKTFISPKQFSKSINKKKIRSISAFHTRNVPHKAHEWIHRFLLNESDMLLIHPLIGQYKKGEYKDGIIIKSNKILAKTYKKKVKVIPFYSYPRYGGPREAALHAIVRKNYGCSKFWVGRDHAGIGKFFNKYASQKFTKKNEKKIGLKIVSEKEPYYCRKKLKILNNCKCSKNQKLLISGSKIRKLILKKKKISNLLMSPMISKFLDKNSIIK